MFKCPLLVGLIAITLLVPSIAHGQVDPEQQQVDKKLAEINALELPSAPSDEDIRNFLKELKKIRESMSVTYSGMESDALAKIPTEKIPFLLSLKGQVDEYSLVQMLLKIDVAPFKQDVLTGLLNYPRLIEVVNKYGWGEEAAGYVAQNLTDVQDSHVKRQLVLLLIENWRTEYLPILTSLLLTERRSKQFWMETVGELGSIDAAARKHVIDTLWISRDTNEMSDEQRLKLAQIAMHQGNVDALFTVLAYLTDPELRDTKGARRVKSDSPPLQMIYSVQSLLGQNLPLKELMDWAMAHRHELRFDEATRRYRLEDNVAKQQGAAS